MVVSCFSEGSLGIYGTFRGHLLYSLMNRIFPVHYYLLHGFGHDCWV